MDVFTVAAHPHMSPLSVSTRDGEATFEILLHEIFRSPPQPLPLPVPLSPSS